MAWIELHQEFRGHPKLVDLARLLDISKLEAAGCIVNLWLWVAQYAPNGNITIYDETIIGDACLLPPEKHPGLLQHLVITEWVDVTKSLQRVIHDWKKYGLRFLIQNRERVRKHREQKRLEEQGKNYGNITSGRRSNVTVTPTLPNLTLPNHTKSKSPPYPPFFDEACNKIWEEYRAHRKDLHKKLTPRAEAMALKRLAVLSSSNITTSVQIIEQSIASGWTGLFELKENKSRTVAAIPPPDRPPKPWTCEYCHQTMSESQRDSHTGPACPKWIPLSAETRKELNDGLKNLGGKMSMKNALASQKVSAESTRGTK